VNVAQIKIRHRLLMAKNLIPGEKQRSGQRIALALFDWY
jgi:hypothetical protein